MVKGKSKIKSLLTKTKDKLTKKKSNPAPVKYKPAPPTEPEAEKMINSMLSAIEKKNGFKILFAVESGSRSWNLHSSDSDYDVKFVYHYPASTYLGLSKPDDSVRVVSQDKSIDMLGMDIYKFTKLILTSNPSILEWLNSNIIYKKDKSYTIYKKFISKNYNPLALYHHYRSMCRQNYLKYLKTGNDVKIKRYLYAMRGLVNAEYTLATNTPPPIDFQQTLSETAKLETDIPETVFKKLSNIIELKQQKQNDTDNINLFDSFIEKFLAKAQQPIPTSPPSNKQLNDYILSLLKIKRK